MVFDFKRLQELNSYRSGSTSKESQIVFRFAKDLAEENVSFVLEKTLFFANGGKCRVDLAVFHPKTQKLLAIVEFKGFNSPFSNTSRVAKWEKTHQARKYKMFGVPVFLVCCQKSYDYTLEELIDIDYDEEVPYNDLEELTYLVENLGGTIVRNKFLSKGTKFAANIDVAIYNREKTVLLAIVKHFNVGYICNPKLVRKRWFKSSEGSSYRGLHNEVLTIGLTEDHATYERIRWLFNHRLHKQENKLIKELKEEKVKELALVNDAPVILRKLTNEEVTKVTPLSASVNSDTMKQEEKLRQ